MNNTETTHSICRDIFKAIHEGRWLSIEYQNKNDKITKYWIGIRDINPRRRTLKVDGLHLAHCTVESYDCIYIDSILSSNIIEGSYCERNQELIEDIYLNPEKYRNLFDNVANLKILNYLEECNRMDTTPYKSDFKLVKYLDRESLVGEFYSLNKEQFKTIVDNFQYKTTKDSKNMRIQQLAMNVLSVHTVKGLHVLAYRKLELDVKRRVLRPAEDITICTEFTIDGVKESIRKYLDGDDYELLSDFEKNAEIIKNHIQRQNVNVDDMPYFIGLGMDVILDLRKEYKAILNMYQSDNVTIPIKAFFGDLLKRPTRYKAYPIALINHRINIDQLLAINNAMKYPLAYIQGPPGTGKTNTIINTISTAFFNEKTVLFASYNNHPIDGVFEKLTNLQYKGKRIPFPIIRLGNNEKIKETVEYIKDIYERTKNVTIFDKTLDRNRDNRIARAKQLSDILKKYEELLDLKERQETIKRVLEYNENSGNQSSDIPWTMSLTNQAYNVDHQISQMGKIEEREVLKLLDIDEEEFFKFLYYTSAKQIQGMNKKCPELLEIVNLEDEKLRVEKFNKFLSENDNVKKLLKIFPIVATTCISAHKIGTPEQYFDMVIMDEASQCNTAVSLVPIIRGNNLMLVGDPQQLNPVILLNRITNTQLKKKYAISDEYDYCDNSIYKTYLACDSVSDEVLLRNHYRCNKRIIDFNNRKYYNGKLSVLSKSTEKQPLVYVDVGDVESNEKNTSAEEVNQIIKYCQMNKEKSIGIITPFVNQRKHIEEQLKVNSLNDVSCGTVHAFQGDEKDVILFSTAITNDTNSGTYEWLKNNKELINVATSRAKNKLIILSSMKNVERLHREDKTDDLYELIQYTRSNGKTEVTEKTARSRALGVKPFSTAIEEAFLENLRHALGNIWFTQNKYVVKKEVAISHVFMDNTTHSDLFYSGRFDFVVYEVNNKKEIPVLAIELDGKEHFEDEIVQARDKKKNEICKAHQLELIRVENSYARRYNHIKDILSNYFAGLR